MHQRKLMLKNKKNKTVGILGLGSIGLRHAKNCLEKKVKVYGYDPNKTKIREAKNVGIETKLRNEIVGETQNFIICSPSFQHHDDLKFVIKYAKKVLIEKPLTHDYLKTLKLTKKNSSVVIFTAFNLRFHSVVRKIKEILDTKILGKILWSQFIVCSDLRNWRANSNIKKNYTNNIICGGVINDYSHEIDLVNFFFGKNQKVISFVNNSKTLGLKVDDYASILMCSEKKIFSNIQMDYCTGPSIRKGVIRGINASIFYDLLKRKIKIVNSKGNVILNEHHSSSFDQEYKDEIDCFIKKNKKKSELATLEDGLEVSKVIKNIYKIKKEKVL